MVAEGPDSGPGPDVPDARTALLLCLLALPGAPARAGAPDGGPAGLEVRSGRVAAVDWGDRRVTLLGPAGRLDLGFDRNTVVYLPGRLGTLRDVKPGVEARASVGPDGIAAWIEVRPRPGDGGAPAGPGGGAPARPDGAPGERPDGAPGEGPDGADGGVPRRGQS
jgi:hypothetical protein